MPSFVGSVNIKNIGNGSFTVGDALRISPNASGQDNAGAGSFNTGAFIIVSDKKNRTNVNDPDLADEFTLSIKPFL